MQANIPDRLNAVLVPEGIARVSYVADSKMTNTGTFTFRREDHTLGNLLRMYVPLPYTPTWWWACWLVYLLLISFKGPLTPGLWHAFLYHTHREASDVLAPLPPHTTHNVHYHCTPGSSCETAL